MLPIDSPLFWTLALLGTLFTGISKSGFAGGAGVVAVPLLAFVIPAPLAAALVLPLLILMDVRILKLYRSHLQMSGIRRLLFAALIGIGLGGTALASLPEEGLLILLACFSLLFSFWHQLSPILGRIPGSAFIWGSLSGLSSTLLHAGGPPVAIYFMGQQISKSQWLAQAGIFFAAMNLIKLIPYSLNEVWSWQMGWVVLALSPFAWLGVWLGYRLQAHVNEAGFLMICRGLLFCSGLGLLIKLNLVG